MSKITKSAKGQQCQIRIPGVCNGNRETVVAAHLNGYGMGCKNPDLFISYACSACHDEVDARTWCQTFKRSDISRMFYEGIFRTQTILLRDGLIKI